MQSTERKRMTAEERELFSALFALDNILDKFSGGYQRNMSDPPHSAACLTASADSRFAGSGATAKGRRYGLRKLREKVAIRQSLTGFSSQRRRLTMGKEYIEREVAKARLRIWITDCVLNEANEAADCFRLCIDLLDSIPAADVAPAVELEDLRAKYQALVAEKDKNSGDTAETYTTGYRYGHRNGQIELLQQILDICDGVSEQEEEK